MSISKASAHWDGTLKAGKGGMTPAHGTEIPFSFGTRFEGKPGSNPEEMVGAALAGCFSMALSLALETAGHPPTAIHTGATVTLERDGGGFAITSIELTTEVAAPGLDEAKLKVLAEETKEGCPVSKALAGVRKLTVDARLRG